MDWTPSGLQEISTFQHLSAPSQDGPQEENLRTTVCVWRGGAGEFQLTVGKKGGATCLEPSDLSPSSPQTILAVLEAAVQASRAILAASVASGPLCGAHQGHCSLSCYKGPWKLSFPPNVCLTATLSPFCHFSKSWGVIFLDKVIF